MNKLKGKDLFQVIMNYTVYYGRYEATVDTCVVFVLSRVAATDTTEKSLSTAISNSCTRLHQSTHI